MSARASSTASSGNFITRSMTSGAREWPGPTSSRPATKRRVMALFGSRRSWNSACDTVSVICPDLPIGIRAKRHGGQLVEGADGWEKSRHEPTHSTNLGPSDAGRGPVQLRVELVDTEPEQQHR